MSDVAEARSQSTPVALFLSGARVTTGFREALHDAASRAGVTPNEYTITAAAEKLAQRGASFPGVFRKGDMPEAQRYREICLSLADDFGGAAALTEVERRLIRQAALVKTETDRVQNAVLRGEPVDAAHLDQLTNALTGMMNDLAASSRKEPA